MFGISCCGINPLNDFEEICCDNVTRNRKHGAGFVNRCCGNETLSYDQTCCQGVVSFQLIHEKKIFKSGFSNRPKRFTVNLLCVTFKRIKISISTHSIIIKKTFF